MRIPLSIRLIIRGVRRAKSRQSFVQLLGQWLYDGASFALLYYILRKYRWLAGWDGNQVLFLYAFHLFTFSVSATVCYGLCVSLPQKIRTGELDQALLKPINPLLYALSQEIRVDFLTRAPVALAAMCFSYGGMNIIISPISILLWLIMLISALLSQSSLWIAVSSFSFLIKGKNPFAAWIETLSAFTRYPLQIYGALMQTILTFLVPLGFASFYPASAVVNAITDLALPSLLPYIAPLAGVFLLFASVKLWHHLRARYQSATEWKSMHSGG